MKVATRITVATAVVVALASAAYAYFDLSRVRREREEQLEVEAKAVANTLRLVMESQASAFRTPTDAQLKSFAGASSWKVTVIPRMKADVLGHDAPSFDRELGWLRVMIGDPTQRYSGVYGGTYHYAIALRTAADEKPVTTGMLELSKPAEGLSSDDLARVLTLIVLIVTVTTLMVGALAARLFSRPIRKLLQGIDDVAKGDLSHVILAERDDEIGQIATRFNEMTFSLRESRAETQRQNEAKLALEQRLGQTEKLATIGQLAAEIAHEVGTPLNLISCHVELLRGDLATDPRSAGMRMELISDQIERIERIVRNILDRTRIAAPELEPLDLRTLVERVCRATAPTLDARGVKVSTELAADLPLIAGESDHLQQVLINLFNNALDAMPDGGELRIRAFLQRNRVVLEVADTGCGMSPETRARIFDPLYTTKQRGRGTGLGLAVVSQFVEEHHGTIEVDSEPGRGALFRLGFPVAGSSESVDTREETYEADPSGR